MIKLCETLVFRETSGLCLPVLISLIKTKEPAVMSSPYIPQQEGTIEGVRSTHLHPQCKTSAVLIFGQKKEIYAIHSVSCRKLLRVRSSPSSSSVMGISAPLLFGRFVVGMG